MSSAERRFIRSINFFTNLLIVISVLLTVTITVIVMDEVVRQWFWENAFSRPWWPMPATPK